MKYLPGQMFGQFSGSAGATTASHNRYASYVRTRVIPVNPMSGRQTVVRDAFTFLSHRWRELTESQRTAWADLAVQVPILGPQGNQIILAGNAFFAKLNLQRLSVQDAFLDDAPALDQAPAPTITGVTTTIAVGGTMEIAYTMLGGSATAEILVRASAPRSAGKTYVSRGELKQIGDFASNAVSPFDFQAAYEAIFGTGWLAPPGLLGMEIVVQILGISTNGFSGSPVTAFSLIA